MKNLKKIIQAATIATVLLGTAQISLSYARLELPCGAATILAGFKFKVSSCKKNETPELSIANTYGNTRKLTIDGTFIITNGNAYHVPDAGISVIDFPAREGVKFNVKISTSGSGYTLDINSLADINRLTPTKSISISCKSGTKRIAGVVITPICSSQEPSFFVENTSPSSNKWVAYHGVRGAFKFKNFRYLNKKGGQDKFNLSIISNPSSSSSQAYTFAIYEGL